MKLDASLPRRSWRLIMALSLSMLLVSAPLPSLATICLPYSQIAKRLINKYGERPVSGGVTSNGGIMRLYVNPRTLSWTLVYIKPPGHIGCFVSAGYGWRGDWKKRTDTSWQQ